VGMLLMPLLVHGQLDSLRRELIISRHDTTKVRVLLAITDELLKTNLDSALYFINQAEQLSAELKAPTVSAQVYALKGNILIRQGFYDNALEYCLKALHTFRELKDERRELGLYNNIGAIYDRKKDFRKAREYYFKSYELLNKIKPSMSGEKYADYAGQMLSNIGATYSSEQNFEQGMAYYQKALVLAKKYKQEAVMGLLHTNIGMLYMSRGQLEKALENVEKGLALRLKTRDNEGAAKSYGYLGSYYFAKKEYPTAIEYLEKSFDLGEEIGALANNVRVADMMSKAYAALGQYESAYTTGIVHKQLSDSISNEESTRKFAQLEMQYQFDMQQQAEAVRQKEKELKYLVAGSILMLIIVIGIVLYIIQRNKALRSQLAHQQLQLENQMLVEKLEFRNKELTTNVLYIVKKNELINDISARLLELKKQLKKENAKPMERIVLDLQSELDQGAWDEFELRFQQVHEEFYNELNTRFPDLTPNEKKLCAFLRLNMTTKEISSITQQSIKSVEVARTRLRKKLDLNNTSTNLITYLSQL
ncbi:MAG TPA: tetratricopeptide repeat protein, partial [Pontibacter sp.]